jgi:hypothetical protein
MPSYMEEGHSLDLTVLWAGNCCDGRRTSPFQPMGFSANHYICTICRGGLRPFAEIHGLSGHETSA